MSAKADDKRKFSETAFDFQRTTRRYISEYITPQEFCYLSVYILS
jgi:hypothetical protein